MISYIIEHIIYDQTSCEHKCPCCVHRTMMVYVLFTAMIELKMSLKPLIISKKKLINSLLPNTWQTEILKKNDNDTYLFSF